MNGFLSTNSPVKIRVLIMTLFLPTGDGLWVRIYQLTDESWDQNFLLTFFNRVLSYRV